MDDAAIKTLVEPILKSRLADFGYEGVTVRSGEDHDGDPVLFVRVSFDPGDRLLGGERSVSIGGEIRSTLWKNGEDRFAHMRWHYINGDYAEADDGALQTEAAVELF